MALWLVRCGAHGEGESFALTHGVVGIGWAELGDLSTVRSLDAIKQRLREYHPDDKPSKVSNQAGRLDAFTHRIKEGDLIALPLKTAPAVAFGRVIGGYGFAAQANRSPTCRRSSSTPSG